jgi:hypothetical protein
VSTGRLQLKCDGTRWHREGKWRGNWRMEWVASTLHITSEHGVSSITTADTHTSVASSRLNWRPRRFKRTRPFRRKTKSGFCACAVTFQLASKCLPSFRRILVPSLQGRTLHAEQQCRELWVLTSCERKEEDRHELAQGCTNPRLQIVTATKLHNLATSICGSSFCRLPVA